MPLVPGVAIGGGASFPRLPNMGARPPQTTPTGGAALDRANIDSLLRGEFDPYEINMQSAENAIGGGVPGSGFAQAGRYKLLDSEKLARKRMGNEMLDPYLNRAHQQQLQTQSEAARLKEIAAQGELAMQQLQASQSGRMAELSQQERAQLEYLAQQGNQALEQLRLQQSGQREITGMNIGGNIINTLLSRVGGSGGGGGTASPTRPTSSTHGFSGLGSANAWAGSLAGSGFMNPASPGGYMMAGQNFRPPPPYGGMGGGADANVTNLVSDILRRYGFPNLRF